MRTINHPSRKGRIEVTRGTIGFILFLIAVIFSAPVIIYIGVSNGPDAQCAKVYEGPAHERCVYRMMGGGPIYEENIDIVK